jgi:hypothetical protein
MACLARGPVCNLHLLLRLASAVFLGSVSAVLIIIFDCNHFGTPERGGPGSYIYFPKEYGIPVTLSDTGFLFCRLLRLSELRRHTLRLGPHERTKFIRYNVRCAVRCRNIKKPMDPVIQGKRTLVGVRHNITLILYGRNYARAQVESCSLTSHLCVSLNGARQTGAQLTSIACGISLSLS